MKSLHKSIDQHTQRKNKFIFSSIWLTPLFFLIFIAQPSPVLAATEIRTLQDTLEQLTDELGRETKFSEETKKILNNKLNNAGQALENALKYQAKTASLNELIQNPYARTDDLSSQIEALVTSTNTFLKKWDQTDHPQEDTLEDFDRRTSALNQSVLKYISQIESTKSDLIKTAQASLEKIDNLISQRQGIEASNVPLLESSALEHKIEQLVSQAQLIQLNTEIGYREKASLNFAKLTEFLNENLSALSSLQKNLLQNSNNLQQALNRFRQSLMQQKITQLASMTQDNQALDNPIVKELNQMTKDFLLRNEKNLVREKEIVYRIAQLKLSTQNLQADYEQVKNIIAVGGKTERVSKILRQKRKLVMESYSRTVSVLSYQEELNDVMLQSLDIEQSIRKDFIRIKFLDPLLSDTSTQISDKGSVIFQNLVDNYRDAGRDLAQTLRRIAAVLSELQSLSSKQKNITAEFKSFLDKTILWLPSDTIDFQQDLKTIMRHHKEIFQKNTLLNIYNGFYKNLTTYFSYLVFGLVFIYVFHIKNNLLIKGVNASRVKLTKISPEVIFGIKRFIAKTFTWPIFIFLVGLVISGSYESVFNENHLSNAFMGSALALCVINVIRQLVVKKFKFLEYLGLPKILADRLYSELSWLRIILPSIVFFSQISSSKIFLEEVGTIFNRIFLFAGLITVSVFGFRIALLRNKILSRMRLGYRNKWLIYCAQAMPLFGLTPILLSSVILIGYHYTGLFIAKKLLFSLCFVWLLYIIWCAYQRYFDSLNKHSLVEKLSLLADNFVGPVKPSDQSNVDLEAQKLAHEKNRLQSNQLMKVILTIALIAGFAWIWSDFYDIFIRIDQVDPGTLSETSKNWILIGRFFEGALIATFGFFLAKNLPGFIDLFLLQKLSISSGTNYAVKTISQYLIVTITLITFCQVLGLQWSSIQWLVAALSVGLGFGLQEIVANFISGIILLFEQPIRVGDIITINGVSGSVTKIKIRATTILNWDKQEFIIPNKSFITGELINWTLSDTTNRLVFNIGIAYESDPAKAIEILQTLALERPEVLDDPEPLVTFEEFGDNALLIVARMYLATLENRLKIRTEINLEINRRFTEAGIIIAFPQRDLHINKPIEVSLKTSSLQTT